MTDWASQRSTAAKLRSGGVMGRPTAHVTDLLKDLNYFRFCFVWAETRWRKKCSAMGKRKKHQTNRIVALHDGACAIAR
jgi:hypothetical protein